MTSKSELKRLLSQAEVSRPKTINEKGKEVFVSEDETYLEVSVKDAFTVGVNAKTEEEARDKAYESLCFTYFPEQPAPSSN